MRKRGARSQSGTETVAKRSRTSVPKENTSQGENSGAAASSSSRLAGKKSGGTRSKNTRTQIANKSQNQPDTVTEKCKDGNSMEEGAPDILKTDVSRAGAGRRKLVHQTRAGSQMNASSRGRGSRKSQRKCQVSESVDEVDSSMAPTHGIPNQQISTSAGKRGRCRGRPTKEGRAQLSKDGTSPAKIKSNPVTPAPCNRGERQECKVEVAEESSDSDDFEDVPDAEPSLENKQVSLTLSTPNAVGVAEGTLSKSAIKEELSDSDEFEDVLETKSPKSTTQITLSADEKPVKIKLESGPISETNSSNASKRNKPNKKRESKQRSVPTKVGPEKRKKPKEKNTKEDNPKKRKLNEKTPLVGQPKLEGQIDLVDVAAMIMKMEGAPQPSTSGLKRTKGGNSKVARTTDSEGSDWEEVEELQSTAQSQTSASSGPIVVTVEAPDGIMRKRRKKAFDWQAYLRRRMKRYQKEVQVSMHKVHVLCLLSLGMQQNGICGDFAMKSIALSVLPLDLLKRKWASVDAAGLKGMVTWFRDTFPIEPCEDPTALTLVRKSVLEKLFAAHKAHSTEQLAVMLVLALRAVGVECRLVCSLQPLALKFPGCPSSSSKTTDKKLSKKKDKTGEKPAVKKVKMSDKGVASAEKKPDSKTAKKLGKKDQKESKNTPNDVREQNDTESSSKPPKGKSLQGKLSKRARQSTEVIPLPSESDSRPDTRTPSLRARRTVQGKRKSQVKVDSEDDLDSSDEYCPSSSDDEGSNFSDEEKSVSCSSRRTGKGKTTPRAQPKSRSSLDSSEDDFENSQVAYRSPTEQRQKFASKKNRKVLSDSSDGSQAESRVKGCDMWAEVFLPYEDKWICVDCTSGGVNSPYDIEARATHPLHYVLAFSADGSVKDVTARYASKWLTHTRRLRVDQDWWEETLLPYKGKNSHSNHRDDDAMKEQLMKKPLPTSIGEYKNHPLYVLSRHLLKYEALYPDTAVPLGYIRHEPVYARECVHTLHSRENWLKEGRLVRIGETPYKCVKSRKKWNQTNDNPEALECELFGLWQTEIYIPPPAVDGKVPKNEYGNVELFQPWMLPGGTVHVQVPGLQRIARKLSIDIAPAMVGWDHHCGWPHPVLEGWIVCEEHRDILLAAWEEDQEIQKQREEEKREKRALGNWKLLVKGLLIKQRLKKRFDQKEELVKLVQEAAVSSDTEDEDRESKGEKGKGRKGRKGKKKVEEKEADSGEVAMDVKQSWPNRRKAFKLSQ